MVSAMSGAELSLQAGLSGKDFPDVGYALQLINFFRLELHVEFLLVGQHQVQMPHRVPIGDGFWRSAGADLGGRDLEDVGGDRRDSFVQGLSRQFVYLRSLRRDGT